MKINCSDEFELKNIMPKNEDVRNLTSFFYAFSDETRLKIIILLILKPLCVGDISQVLSIHQTTISHQLKILKSLNIVSCDKLKKNIIYYITNPTIEEVLNAGVDFI